MEDDLYFDNQDDLSVDDQLLGDDEGGESSFDRGDLNIALKKEREEKRQLKEQLSQREKDLEQRARDLERHQALLQQLGQRQQPQVDPEVARTSLADRLLERPDEVLNQRDSALLSHVQKRFAPLEARSAKLDVLEHPEYGDLYKNRPAFKKTVNAWIENAADAYGQVDPRALNETLAYLAEIANESGQGSGKPSTDAAKQKLTSIVDKGSSAQGKKSLEQILDEKAKLAKTDRKAYLKWADSEAGKQVLNAALQKGL